MTSLDYRAVIADLERRIKDLQTARDVLTKLVSEEGTPPPGPPKERKPRLTASKRVPPKPSAKQSRFAPDAPRIRKLAIDHYELTVNQLKEKYNLAPSTETIRQMLVGKIYPDPDYDPKEWIELHSGKA